MKKKKIPMRKCIITNEMRPKKEMIRILINKEGQTLPDGPVKQQAKGASVSKDVKSVEDAQKNGVLEKYFNESPEKLDPVYKEVIRLIYREEIPK